MNTLVVTEAILVAAAVYAAIVSHRHNKAILIASVIIGSAALLGFLKYSQLLPLPELHRLFTVISSTVALPLLAVAVIWPTNSVSRSIRYASIFTFIAAFLGVILVTVAEIDSWRTACSLISVLSIVIISIARQQWIVLLAGLLLLFALIALTKKIAFAGLLPGDLMHLSLAAGLLVVSLSFRESNQASSSQ